MTLTSVPGVRVGHAEVGGGGSGCTVILGSFRGAVEVRGLATGSRELGVLSPLHLAERIHGVLLTGGSAFGLAAADGVVAWLEERGIGLDVGVTRVPLVPAAVIFDLAPGVPRPGPAEGRRACEDATDAPVREGRVGAGAGATVGKVAGPLASSPGGLGSASGRWGAGSVGALAVVNALGDVVSEDGTVLAGARTPDGAWLGSDAVMGSGRWGVEFREAAAEGTGGLKGDMGSPSDLQGEGADGRGRRKGDHGGHFGPGGNTTLVVLATDLPLSRVALRSLARLSATAFPRAIVPVHTPYDGDILFALSTSEAEETLHPSELAGLGVYARGLVEEAIRRAALAGAAGPGNGSRTTT